MEPHRPNPKPTKEQDQALKELRLQQLGSAVKQAVQQEEEALDRLQAAALGWAQARHNRVQAEARMDDLRVWTGFGQTETGKSAS